MRRWCLLPLVVAVALSAGGTALADDGGSAEVDTTTDGLWVGVLEEEPSQATPGGSASGAGTPVVSVDNAPDLGTELLDEFCTGTNWSGGCTQEPIDEVDEGPPPPTVTPGMVATAFAELPLPASVLVVQPPDGRTLVNFATNFYTESEPFTEVVRLLGQRVELRIWPSRFTWVFGDGASAATSSPGAAYPALEVTHEYRRAGRVAPRVDTTYAAEFRVNGGAWAPVAGTVTIPGEPVGLRVETATPVLVAYE